MRAEARGRSPPSAVCARIRQRRARPTRTAAACTGATRLGLGAGSTRAGQILGVVSKRTVLGHTKWHDDERMGKALHDHPGKTTATASRTWHAPGCGARSRNEEAIVHAGDSARLPVLVPHYRAQLDCLSPHTSVRGIRRGYAPPPWQPQFRAAVPPPPLNTYRSGTSSQAVWSGMNASPDSGSREPNPPSTYVPVDSSHVMTVYV